MTRRRNPFEDIERMFERMSEQFEGVGDVGGVGGLEEVAGGSVSVDVAETDEEVTVTADLPGYGKDDIDISVRDGRLTIRAEQQEATEREEETYHRRERVHREINRTLRLPAEVDEEEASATYQNGVLTVTLPKTEAEPDGHSIDVE
ncbi:MAG: archaeal heat shock protein Hsp14 [Haloferacaceae archaeon]